MTTFALLPFVKASENLTLKGAGPRTGPAETRDKASRDATARKGQRPIAFGLMPMYTAVKRPADSLAAPGLTRLLRDHPDQPPP